MSDQANGPVLTSAAPVAAAERIGFLDMLRGLAVMAIFVVNIKAMMMPFPFYLNPSLWISEFDQVIALAQKFLIDDKWRTIFTALYGAGLMMMWERLESRGQTRGVLFKRTSWLIVFGAIHLFGFWVGDILFIYGTTGLIAILMVRLRTTSLCIAGIVLLVIGTAWISVFSAGPVFDPELRAELEPAFWLPSAESIDEQIAIQQGPILGQLQSRLTEGRDFLLFYFLLGGMLPTSLGLMLIGMVLYRTGLVRGAWRNRRTVPLAIICLGAAWLLDWFQIQALKESSYDFDVHSLNQWMASLDGYLGGFGFCCLVSALARAGLQPGALIAVGRMAFTNYIACTLIGTTLAVGHGFGWFGQANLSALMAVVAGTFVAMLIWSSWWLGRYRFGPLEWLWRSLVYGQRQAFKRGDIGV